MLSCFQGFYTSTCFYIFLTNMSRWKTVFQHSAFRFTTEKCEHSTLAIVNLLVTWACIWASIAIFVPSLFILICKTHHQYRLRIQCRTLFTKKRKLAHHSYPGIEILPFHTFPLTFCLLIWFYYTEVQRRFWWPSSFSIFHKCVLDRRGFFYSHCQFFLTKPTSLHLYNCFCLSLIKGSLWPSCTCLPCKGRRRLGRGSWLDLFPLMFLGSMRKFWRWNVFEHVWCCLVSWGLFKTYSKRASKE